MKYAAIIRFSLYLLFWISVIFPVSFYWFNGGYLFSEKPRETEPSFRENSALDTGISRLSGTLVHAPSVIEINDISLPALSFLWKGSFEDFDRQIKKTTRPAEKRVITSQDLGHSRVWTLFPDLSDCLSPENCEIFNTLKNPEEYLRQVSMISLLGDQEQKTGIVFNSLHFDLVTRAIRSLPVKKNVAGVPLSLSVDFGYSTGLVKTRTLQGETLVPESQARKLLTSWLQEQGFTRVSSPEYSQSDPEDQILQKENESLHFTLKKVKNQDHGVLIVRHNGPRNSLTSLKSDHDIW